MLPVSRKAVMPAASTRVRSCSSACFLGGVAEDMCEHHPASSALNEIGMHCSEIIRVIGLPNARSP